VSTESSPPPPEPSVVDTPPFPPPAPLVEKQRTQSINVRTIGSATSLSNPSNFPPSPTEENMLWDIENELENMRKGLEM
jgi:hypothetical protein